MILAQGARGPGVQFPEQPFVSWVSEAPEDPYKTESCQIIAEPGFDPGTFGL